MWLGRFFALDSFLLIIKKDAFKLVRCDGYVTRNWQNFKDTPYLGEVKNEK